LTVTDADVKPRRAAKPKASEKLAEWPPPPPKKTEDDELVGMTEDAVMRLLASELDAKDMNAAIANAIRLIQVKNRIKEPEEIGNWWSSRDDDG